MSRLGRSPARIPPPRATAFILAGLLLLAPPAPAAAQSSDRAASGSSAEPLPACEWCGTAEAPAGLEAHVRIGGDDEPGERLVVRGVVYEPDGVTPADDVLLYLYHTNAEGIYEKRGDETGNGRRHGHLRGWLRTDDRGRYEIRTIRPASYPGRSEAQHIHVTVQEPDGTPEYWLPSFKFADDPLLDDDASEPHVLELERRDGAWQGRRDIVLPEETRR